MEDISQLTAGQRTAFKRLKLAYKECEKAGIYFTNNYGSLTAWNSEYVNGYSDRVEDVENGIEEPSNSNSFNVANKWSDDTHYIGLTRLGILLIKEQN